jgi:hypothetical protein
MWGADPVMTLRSGLSTVMMLSWVLAPASTGDQQPSAWAVHLEATNVALARGDINRAVEVWHDGYAAALRSRTWQALVEVGDAYLQIADAGSFRASAKPMARRIYLDALTRARAQRSVDGALRVATAFDGLGDREVVEQCVRVAEKMAREQRDATTMQQVTAARARLALQLGRPRTARP